MTVYKPKQKCIIFTVFTFLRILNVFRRIVFNFMPNLRYVNNYFKISYCNNYIFIV